ncbi:hypothetical protein C8R43DRAFT_1174527 [Mycena crocata]|nr:hypothetical protein C8R43DRAFT_1174527 [Mycena crocata]
MVWQRFTIRGLRIGRPASGPASPIPPANHPRTPTQDRAQGFPAAAPGVADGTNISPANVFKSSLEMLKLSGNKYPSTTVCETVDSIIEIVHSIEKTSAKEEGLVQLAERIQLLAPILSEIAREDASSLECLLQTIAADLISDATGSFANSHAAITGYQVLSLRKLKADSEHILAQYQHDSMLRSSASYSSQFDMEDVTASSLGGPGSTGRNGGEGGTDGSRSDGIIDGNHRGRCMQMWRYTGDGTKVEFASRGKRKFGNISGGTGGTGGTGLDVGGKGGMGKASEIRMWARNGGRSA